jgi:hypothetical protein
LALAGLVLLAGCATVPSRGERAVGQGERVFVTLRADFAPVQVSAAEFTTAVTSLVLDMPLRVAPSQVPMRPGRRYAWVSEPLTGGGWQSELARSYGRFCERRGTPGDCLSLFEDGSQFQDDDKRRIALALAVGPALESVDAEVSAMLSPARVAAMVSLSITAYMALLVAPEPVSKGVAAAFALLLWGYLGTELWGLLEGWMALSDESARATTFAELREAGERFGQRIGANSVRILVLVGTAAIGETAALLSKAPKLPGFAQASQMGARQGGVGVLAAAAEAETVIVSVNEGALRVVLPAQVMTMAASGSSSGNIYRAWQSHRGLTRALGSAGKGKQWHHIVEQTPGNVARFGPEALHNTENVIPMPEVTHRALSGYYSSTRSFTGGRTIREWLSTQSYEAQRAFGVQTLRDHGVMP